MKRFLKIILNILLIIILALISFISVYSIKGYILYKRTVKEKPVEAVAESIKSIEHYTALSELPDFYINAVVSVEDKNFYGHGAISIPSIARAILYDIKTLSFEQGGSTITQQLAKNELFTQEKKLERKFAEIFAAFEMEKLFTKDEILELYVNSIYFGNGYYGIYDAAKGYYKKTPKELSQYECAVLAGLPNAPSAFSQDPRLREERAEHVISTMIDSNAITKEQAENIAA